ncbi:hypothetical protein [Methanobrevibacter sp.]|uniref:hypothetical protein n=1 Tax=Methanobrevibacter sp. TaxID=66852 RepID=UPI003864A493
MSSYIKLIIFIVVLLAVSIAIVSMDSSMENINKSMTNISDSIVQGDEDYNESVKLLNERSFYEANQKAQSARDNFNESLEKLLKIRYKYEDDLNNVHEDYFDALINELEIKLKAVDELNQSIYYLENYYNYTGSTHGTEANDLMANAVQFQNERNSIVKENPKLFEKQKGF